MPLADATSGRDGWTLHGSTARFAPAAGGWSARVTPVRVAGRSLDRYHVSIVDAAGLARYTSIASTVGEAVRIAESRVRNRSAPDADRVPRLVLWNQTVDRYASPVIDQAADTGDEHLRRIQAVTDSTLSRLGTDDLFRELLDRVATLIGADIAVIMLVDQEARQLVTVASLGLEEEVRQGFRLDIGVGFTGRVAATRNVVILDEVNETTVASPILRDRGISSLVGVPMFAGGELVGVLHVGVVKPRHFTDQDVALLQLVADRAGLAGHVHQSRADRDATLALQRSLLPARLPAIDGVDLAARYLPGHSLGVGGDWYDVFRLPSGYLGVVVGDVSGHGLRAAVVMGRLRSALRAYALDWDDPADVLTRLDRKIRHFEAGNLATLLYAIISPDRRHITVSTAGHLPPVLGVRRGPSRLLSIPVDVPVGVGHTRMRQSTVVDFPVGAVIVFYTDGLVERRTEVIDQGLSRLCDAVRPGPAETVCATVMASMQVSDAEDDIALLAVRRQR